MISVWYTLLPSVSPVSYTHLDVYKRQTGIEQIDHWISFALLCIIGFSMIRESREQCKPMNNSFSAKVMLPLAIADSIEMCIRDSSSNLYYALYGNFEEGEV